MKRGGEERELLPRDRKRQIRDCPGQASDDHEDEPRKGQAPAAGIQPIDELGEEEQPERKKEDRREVEKRQGDGQCLQSG